MPQMPQPPAPAKSGYYDTDDPSQHHGPYAGAQAAADAAIEAGVPEERICVFRWSQSADIVVQFTPPES